MPASEDESQRQQVSRLLADWSKDDPAARDALVAIVYKELRRLAHHYMQGERANHTLQTTALVNEAYLRLTDLTRMQWRDRAHFFAMAATLMRRILVDHARDRARDKRGGGVVFTALEDEQVAAPSTYRRPRARRGARPARGDRSTARSHRRTALLRRPDDRGNVRSARHLTGDGETRVDVGASLALSPAGRPMSVPPTDWMRVKAIFDAAVVLDPEPVQRASEACAAPTTCCASTSRRCSRRTSGPGRFSSGRPRR